ncbi:MAG: response regulator [Vicinamibacterales bacterium]|jgi:signal transduction histidine kinase/DNA-binding response OmpR family regulator
MATILVVDDLAANRQFLAALLRAQGHRLLEAVNGRDALVVVRESSPGLVITDLLMPVMDGGEFVRRLRLDPATSAIPVAFYTAPYGESEARDLAREVGIADVLLKPAEPGDVQRVINGLLSPGSPALPAPAPPTTTAFAREHLRLLTDLLSDTADDLKISNARLKAVINIGLDLASERDLDRLLQNVCAAARDLFGATYVTLGVLDLKTRTVERSTTCGASHDWIKAGDPLSGVLAAVVAERRTARGGPSGVGPSGSQFPPLHPEVQAFLAAPVASPAHVYGWICFVGNEGQTFSEDDEHLVQALSGLVGRIYETGHFAAIALKRAAELEQEILARHQAVDALQLSEERTRFAMDAAGVGIWDMDFKTGRLQWSAILESQHGLTPGTFGGTFAAFIERVHPEDRDAVTKAMDEAARTGTDFTEEHRTLPADGTVRWLRGAGRVHLGEHGEPVRGVGISLDITSRLALEKQYQQAQKMDAVGRVVGGVAHDFNNLLTVILGYCELSLADLGPDDPRRPDIVEIAKAGGRATALARQLLAFSRKDVIEPRLLDLNAVIAGMRPMLGLLIREDVNIVLGLDPELASVKGDSGQIEQIVMNVAVNARDAMPKGGTLTIATANVDVGQDLELSTPAIVPGPYVVLTMTDTGSGMSPDVLARLFEPFFTTKLAGEGTGLGLATVHDIVTRSGGGIAVTSEVGKGTTFKVFLSKAGAAGMAVDAPLPVARPQTAAHAVLVVDDSPGLCEMARRLLERQGYTVRVAADAAEALQQFEKQPPIDVLLTDVVMPGASGQELTRQLLERHPALRVIYMSGYTDDAIAQHGVLNPGVAFLRKPFTSETLSRKLREVLARTAPVVP